MFHNSRRMFHGTFGGNKTSLNMLIINPKSFSLCTEHFGLLTKQLISQESFNQIF